MSLSSEMRIEIPEGVLLRELQGEAVILNLDSESYFGLDEVGTRMWAALTSAPDVGAATRALLEEFDVPAEELARDLAELVESLAAAGLVRVHSP